MYEVIVTIIFVPLGLVLTYVGGRTLLNRTYWLNSVKQKLTRTSRQSKTGNTTRVDKDKLGEEIHLEWYSRHSWGLRWLLIGILMIGYAIYITVVDIN